MLTCKQVLITHGNHILRQPIPLTVYKTNVSIEFKGQNFAKFPGKTHYLGLGDHNKLPIQLTGFFLDFWAKLVAHLVNYSYLPRSLVFKKKQQQQNKTLKCRETRCIKIFRSDMLKVSNNLFESK